MKDSVISSAKRIGQNIKDAFTGFFDMHSPSRLMASISKHIPGGAIKGMDSMSGKLRSAANRMSEAMMPEQRQISMAYATPSGTYSSLAGAVDGSIDVSSSENNRLLAGIYEELRKQKDMIITLNDRELTIVSSGVRSGAKL
ncbi:hypothetical protein ACA29_17045 [Lederbergia galactosidilytica]|uniref:Uncharacterized protein n=1 Tax=Lederbergia galactosidilytica TaxID=217031 RepID=A0A0Q9XWM4_9BACI|nr:hypothetical protein ACA29_17045 [Lederbergia galactosidilytica]